MQLTLHQAPPTSIYTQRHLEIYNHDLSSSLKPVDIQNYQMPNRTHLLFDMSDLVLVEPFIRWICTYTGPSLGLESLSSGGPVKSFTHSYGCQACQAFKPVMLNVIVVFQRYQISG